MCISPNVRRGGRRHKPNECQALSWIAQQAPNERACVITIGVTWSDLQKFHPEESRPLTVFLILLPYINCLLSDCVYPLRHLGFRLRLSVNTILLDIQLQDGSKNSRGGWTAVERPQGRRANVRGQSLLATLSVTTLGISDYLNLVKRIFWSRPPCPTATMCHIWVSH